MRGVRSESPKSIVSEDVYPPAGGESRMRLKKDLLTAFAQIIPVSENVQQNLHELMAGQMSLGPITDIISYTLPFEVEAKLRLLNEPDVDARASDLVRLLKSGTIQLHSVSVEEQEIDDFPKRTLSSPFQCELMGADGV